jgi:3-hydroxyisobutyrate dehydrogenase-like beta-hydroxyacid dehydrogenase
VRRVGVIGLGQMGSRVAKRFLDAGFEVVVWDRDPERMRNVAVAGARAVESPGALAERVEAAFSLLDDDAAVQKAVVESGLLGSLPAGAVFADLSTTSAEFAEELVEVGAELGVGVLDIAMSGSTEQVEAGELVLLVGGDEALLDEVRPLLAVIAKTVLHMGAAGAGAKMKLVVNTMLGVEMQALAEAIAFGESIGLERRRMLDSLEQLAVLSAAHRPKLANARRDDYPVAFALRLMHKDFGLVLDRAAELGLELPATAASAAVCASTLDAEDEDVDFSAVIREMQHLGAARQPSTVNDGTREPAGQRSGDRSASLEWAG